MTLQTGVLPTSNAEVRVEIIVAAPIERAFKVFTTQMNVWWPGVYRLGEAERSDLIIEPKVGGRWYERGTNGTECDWGKVLAWEPPRHVVLSWQIGVGFVPERDQERVSRVAVRFAEDGPVRTIVTLIHSDFERHGEGWESMREGVAHEGGWPGILEAYAKLLGT